MNLLFSLVVLIGSTYYFLNCTRINPFFSKFSFFDSRHTHLLFLNTSWNKCPHWHRVRSFSVHFFVHFIQNLWADTIVGGNLSAFTIPIGFSFVVLIRCDVVSSYARVVILQMLYVYRVHFLSGDKVGIDKGYVGLHPCIPPVIFPSIRPNEHDISDSGLAAACLFSFISHWPFEIALYDIDAFINAWSETHGANRNLNQDGGGCDPIASSIVIPSNRC